MNIVLSFPDSSRIQAVTNMAAVYGASDVTEELIKKIEKLPECSCKGYIERSKVLEIIKGEKE